MIETRAKLGKTSHMWLKGFDALEVVFHHNPYGGVSLRGHKNNLHLHVSGRDVRGVVTN